MDPRLHRVFVRAMQALVRSRRPHAIGGALALRGHGIIRETRDVDVFLRDDDMESVFRAFRATGFEVVLWAPPHHFAAILPRFRRFLPDYRVDLMVTAIPAELAAIRSPARVRLIGRRARIFPAAELAASKFLAGDPKNRQDVISLLRHGLASSRAVHGILEDVAEGEAAEFARWWGGAVEELRRSAARLPEARVARSTRPGRPTRS